MLIQSSSIDDITYDLSEETPLLQQNATNKCKCFEIITTCEYPP